MIFPSKKDRWLVGLLATVALVQAVAAGAVLVAAPMKWPGVVLLLAAGFIWWLMRSTYYEVDEQQLVVRSGPFRWRVPLDGIKSITPTHNPLSSPALSLDRLWISYRRNGKAKAIMVSPADKQAFLAAVSPGTVSPGTVSPRDVAESIAGHKDTRG